MAQLLVNVPGTPVDADVEVQGLGLFKNGRLYQLTDEQVETFRAVNGREIDPDERIVVGEEGDGLALGASAPVESLPDMGAVDVVEGEGEGQ